MKTERERERVNKGRRGLFRLCAAVFGINVFKEKLPQAYFEDSFLPEAEAHEYRAYDHGCSEGHKSTYIKTICPCPGYCMDVDRCYH